MHYTLPWRTVASHGRRVCRLLAALTAFGAACHSAPHRAAIAPARDEYVTTPDGVRLHVRTLGRGSDTVVVVHGGAGMDMNYLVHGLEPLARGRTLVFYDQRGTGMSGGESDTAHFTMPAFVDDLDAVRRGLKLERVALLGHSWGALLALRFATLHPDRVASLVLVGAMEPGGRYRAETARRQRSRVTPTDSATLARLTRSTGYRRGDVAVVDSVYRVSFRASFSDPSLADRLVVAPTELTARNGGRVARFVFTSLGAYDYWGDLATVRAPVLVVHGADDPIPAQMARELATEMPSAEVLVLPKAGHFPYLEAPTPFAEAVTRFWKERAARTPTPSR